MISYYHFVLWKDLPNWESLFLIDFIRVVFPLKALNIVSQLHFLNVLSLIVFILKCCFVINILLLNVITILVLYYVLKKLLMKCLLWDFCKSFLSDHITVTWINQVCLFKCCYFYIQLLSMYPPAWMCWLT